MDSTNPQSVAAPSDEQPVDLLRRLDETAERSVIERIVQRRRAAECADRRFTVTR